MAHKNHFSAAKHPEKRTTLVEVPTAKKRRRGECGMDDGLRYSYLSEVVPREVGKQKKYADEKARVIAALPFNLHQVWWWLRSPTPVMARFDSQMTLAHLPRDDYGQELGYYYECISRCLGRYLFNVPFQSLDDRSVREVSRLVGDRQSTGNMEKFLMERYDPPQLILNPETWPLIQARFKESLCWSEIFLISFNLRMPANTIVRGIKKKIETLQKKCLPKEMRVKRVHADRRTYRLLELWDVLRWIHDHPKKRCEFEKLVPKISDSERASIANLRNRIKKRFPDLISRPHCCS